MTYTSKHHNFLYFWSYTKQKLPRSVYCSRAVVCTGFWVRPARLEFPYAACFEQLQQSEVRMCVTLLCVNVVMYVHTPATASQTSCVTSKVSQTTVLEQYIILGTKNVVQLPKKKLRRFEVWGDRVFFHVRFPIKRNHLSENRELPEPMSNNNPENTCSKYTLEPFLESNSVM